MTEDQPASRWFAYVVSTCLGLSFLITLLFLALHNALEAERQEFSLESISLTDSVSRNVSASEDVINNLATLVAVINEEGLYAFELLSKSILQRYPFILATSYHPLILQAQRSGFEHSVAGIVHGFGAATAAAPERGDYLPAKYVKDRGDTRGLPAGYDLLSDPRFADAAWTAARTGEVVPTPVLEREGSQRSYLLTKAIYRGKGPQDPEFDIERNTQGIVAVMIDASGLFGHSSFRPGLNVELLSESEGVVGRQTLYRQAAEVEPGSFNFSIATLSKETHSQFGRYSVKLRLGRTVYWQDLNWELVVTAVLLGLGVTLLLIALARAKEIQARELLQRNVLIERKVREQTKELANTRDQALEASRVKSEFLASMSHEIRTPLNAIIGMAELLSDTRLSRDQERYVGVFRKSGEALLALVNDILDLSKIEADQLELEAIPFDIRQLMEETAELYALKTDAKGLELVCHVDQDVPTTLVGDPTRLRQIGLNLIANAIKFTDEGEIVLRVRRDPKRKGEDGRLLFSVSDTGIGIPGEKLESIFKTFTQVDSSTTRKYGGTGLGLTISQRLTHLMDGRIWVESEEGKGSTFWFAVGLGVSSGNDAVLPANGIKLDGKRVLVVDDNASNRLLVGEILGPQGAEVVEADSGEQALEQVRAAADAERPFDLIVLDCKMPDVDGFKVAEAVGELSGSSHTIMMLTSSDLGSHLERLRELNLSTHLLKPVKARELLKAVRQALGALEEAPRPVDAELTLHEERALRILLVEDNVDNRLLVKTYLKKTSHSVDEAENGAEAVQMFKQASYDLVFMDVQMPVMDGYEATRIIRAWERQQGCGETPIIALTAHAIKEDMDKSIRAGCTAHLTKPIKKTTLLEAVVPYSRGMASLHRLDSTGGAA